VVAFSAISLTVLGIFSSAMIQEIQAGHQEAYISVVAFVAIIGAAILAVSSRTQSFLIARSGTIKSIGLCIVCGALLSFALSFFLSITPNDITAIVYVSLTALLIGFLVYRLPNQAQRAEKRKSAFRN
jgi:hypothetical protein